MNLNQDLGQFASPKWPNSYPSGSRCSWRITAPEGHRIQVVIDSFALRQNDLGHCNELMDHVRFLDGGTISSSVIGLYCGSHRPFTIQSSGRDMFIQFNSNNDLNQRDTRQGFHGIYVFKVTNETGIDSRFIDLKGRKESWKGTDDENVEAVGGEFY